MFLFIQSHFGCVRFRPILAMFLELVKLANLTDWRLLASQLLVSDLTNQAKCSNISRQRK